MQMTIQEEDANRSPDRRPPINLKLCSFFLPHPELLPILLLPMVFQKSLSSKKRPFGYISKALCVTMRAEMSNNTLYGWPLLMLVKQMLNMAVGFDLKLKLAT